LQLSLDRQVVSQDCADCAETYTVVRGSVYHNSEPIGLYLIGLHGHDPGGMCARLAIAVLDRSLIPPRAYAAAMVARATGEQYTLALEDWSASPWKDEKYLGEMLNRTAVLESVHKDLFFHIAEHVVGNLIEVQAYLDI
jgi:hypothetical protein